MRWAEANRVKDVALGVRGVVGLRMKEGGLLGRLFIRVLFFVSLVETVIWDWGGCKIVA